MLALMVLSVLGARCELKRCAIGMTRLMVMTTIRPLWCPDRSGTIVCSLRLLRAHRELVCWLALALLLVEHVAAQRAQLVSRSFIHDHVSCDWCNAKGYLRDNLHSPLPGPPNIIIHQTTPTLRYLASPLPGLTQRWPSGQILPV